MLKQNNATFRYLEVNDIPELLEIIDAIKIEEKEKSKNIFLERIRQKQLISILLKNKIVGFIGWSKNYNNNHRMWFIEQITIHSDFRRRGLGLSLLQYFLDICRFENIQTVFASVSTSNEKSLNMFKKLAGEIINKSEDEYLIRINLD